MSTRIRPAILRPPDTWRLRPPTDLRGKERRLSPRYVVSADVELEVAANPGEIAHATLVNISSKGALIATGQCIPVGMAVKVLVPWPSLMNNAAVTLHIAGEAVRATGGLVAIRIVHFAFRTRPAARAAASSAAHVGV